MKKIIVINGSGTSGKDTLVKIAADIAYNKKIKDGYRYGDIYNISSADEVKSIAKTMGWSGRKSNKERKFLSDLKDLWTNLNNGPFNYIIRTINQIEYDEIENAKDDSPFKKMYDFIVFVHVREPEEIQKLVDFYGSECTTLLIKRNNTEKFDNRADAEVDKYEYENIIYNNGTLNDFKLNIEKYMEEIL